MNTDALSKLNLRLSKCFSFAALVFIVLLFTFNLANAIGWALAISWIKHPIPGEPSGMSSGAAVSFLLSACALGINRIPNRYCYVVSILIAMIVTLAGMSTLVEHILHVDWGLSFPLWTSDGAFPLSFPAPMSPDVSSSISIVGLSLLLFFSAKAKLIATSKLVALLVLIPNLLILCSYALGQSNICAYFGCIKLSPVTSATFVMTCFALMLSAPEQGISAAFLQNTIGSKILCRIFLGFIALSTLLPLRMVLIKFGVSTDPPLLDEALANGICGTLAVACTAGVVYWCTRTINLVEIENEEKIKQLDHTINSIVVGQRPYKKICLQCAREFSDEYSDTCPDDSSALSRVVDNLAPGTKFSEDYEIVGPLGEGGLSKVFLAKNDRTNKQVALKVLHSHLTSDTKAIQRFQREAKALGKLSHGNILTCYEFKISDDGIPFIIMDYLEGESLYQKLKREGRLTWQETVQIFSQVCQGLSHAHEKGIIHRDLKPSNIMLVPDKDKVIPKVVDFGLAKEQDGDSFGRLTQTGEVMGTPTYMAPEQCSGKPIDQRTDVYATGCMVYECLTGRPPFLGRTALEIMVMHIKEPVPELPDDLNVPAWLSEVIKKSLKKNPTVRHQSIADLGAALCQGLETTVNTK